MFGMFRSMPLHEIEAEIRAIEDVITLTECISGSQQARLQELFKLKYMREYQSRQELQEFVYELQRDNWEKERS